MVKFLEHRYGPNVHIMADPYLNTLLGDLCSPETVQPSFNQIILILYQALIQTVIAREFETKSVRRPTRMTAQHPDIQWGASVIDPDQKAVTVALARAGTFPSELCFNLLNYVLRPENVRQDHIFASRVSAHWGGVQGTDISCYKIGGSIQGAALLLPDPMGATGGTTSAVINHYKKNVEGVARIMICLNLIITPEYIRAVQSCDSDVIIYACRLDRGLSSDKVLASIPGTFWNDERGLNDQHYIVPGGGGFGEIMNNSFV